VRATLAQLLAVLAVSSALLFAGPARADCQDQCSGSLDACAECTDADCSKRCSKKFADCMERCVKKEAAKPSNQAKAKKCQNKDGRTVPCE
jgi:hypothetical protein